MKGRGLGSLVFCCVVGQMAWSSVARADENRDQGAMDEVVVTATRTPKTLAEVPADVTVVTKEELKKKNYINVSEALETVPGVMSYSGTGAVPGPPASPVVNLRGFHGAMRTMIMVNGQPISPFLYAASLVHWSAIPVDAIERIEVVRGPFSALYGGDAVGGLINIITKVPDKFETTVRSGYGSDNTFKEHISIGNRFFGKLSAFASYDFKKTDSYVGDYYILKPTTAGAATPVSGAIKQPYRTGGTSYIVGDRGRYDYDEHTFTFNTKLDITPTSSIRTNALYSFYGIDPFGSSSYLRDSSGNEIRSGRVNFGSTYLNVTSGGFLTSRAEKATGIYSMEYINNVSDALRIKLSGGLTDFSKDRYMSPGSSATENGGSGTYQEAPSRIWTGDLQADYKVSKWMLLTTGFGYRRDEGTYKSYAASNWRDYSSVTTLNQIIEPESNRYGFFLQAEVTPVDRLTIFMGIRYDRWDSAATRTTSSLSERLQAHDRDAFSPKLSFIYTPFRNTIFRLSGGRAFRVPNFFELYQPLSTSAGQKYVPNPSLKPEITWSWEAGVEQALFSDWTHLNLTYFEHYTKDFIDSRTYADPSDPTVTIYQRDNFGKVEVRGVELGVRQKFTEYLSGFANYTYIHGEITENKNYPKYVGNQPRYVPKNMFNLGLDLNYKPFSASWITHYRSRMYTNNANDTVNYGVYGVQDEIPFVTDITVGYDFLEKFNFKFTVSNLFDSRYYMSNLAPGRKFFGMLTAKF